MERHSGRAYNKLRDITIETNINDYAEGSCLIICGKTKVICLASYESKAPHFLKGTGSGWISAEYSMLPRATKDRTDREAVRGKQTGRTQEIQRLIGRSLRSVMDLSLLGERQIKIDCDVIQADGGTRTAAITGGYVALFLACQSLMNKKIINKMPIVDDLAAISCGIKNGKALLDLDYLEDSSAEADANFVMTSSGKIIEAQITSEKHPIDKVLFDEMFALAQMGINQIISLQRKTLLQVK